MPDETPLPSEEGTTSALPPEVGAMPPATPVADAPEVEGNEEAATEPPEVPGAPEEQAADAPTPEGDPVPPADPRSLNDRRRDEDAILGHFVNVVSGEHEGRYGVFVDVAADGETAIVRSRDADNDVFSTAISDLRPAKAGLR